ncbi:hypothetical protein [Actinoplanes sp. RD1]|nr:hypothetical protein [Actinoplanes sp. RD1]
MAVDVAQQFLGSATCGAALALGVLESGAAGGCSTVLTLKLA